MADGERIEAFIARWQGREGGQERASYGLFLTELCELLGLGRPDPASGTNELNDYVFERAVRGIGRDGTPSWKRIDLYHRNRFILEAKQSRWRGGAKAIAGQETLFRDEHPGKDLGRRGAERAWDVLMVNARRQAEDYVRLLPADHQPPPFLLVCDVGHCIEVYANFRRDGKAYDQFPDRQGFRIYLEDLRKPEIQERLTAIWERPETLDPSRHAAKVTRDIAERLAAVSKALEGAHPPEEVALFVMRLLFTMFAEDVGLLPPDCLKKLLAECETNPRHFIFAMGDLWGAMDRGQYSGAIGAEVRRFNGKFFKDPKVLELGREEIGELRRAADHDWKDVEPAIFGALLEQALNPEERRRLGAHFTPRAYVERLVVATVIDPLRAEWKDCLSTVDRQRREGRTADAIGTIQAFHDRLCATRVLDPACGTGNFLYVALELMKRLEGEVLEVLVDLGGQESLRGLSGHTVDPSSFFGIEINPRAAAIAELVLWIGFLQWHLRTRGGAPEPPILRALGNIHTKDALITWDGYPVPQVVNGKEIYPNLRRTEWPEAEFIVGNPPFIGGKDMRARLEPGRAEAVWQVHPHMNESADFVLYWWDRAAELLTRTGTKLRRFGFVTTNSISQVLQRRVVERHLKARPPVSIVMAIPDHPWTRATPKTAAVRIAMTVAEAGRKEGLLRDVMSERDLDTDAPVIGFEERAGLINSDLTIGADVTATGELLSNHGLCAPGVKLHGSGFIVRPGQAQHLGLDRRPGLEEHVRGYRNGRDLASRPRGALVIDLLGLDEVEVRRRFPEIYQHLLGTVKPERDRNNRASYRENWWLFGEPRRELRPALAGLRRYIATIETAKHRVFQFLDASILPDNMLVAVASQDATDLGVLSSRFHLVWASRQGGTLEDRPRYSKSRCFDPFPFPLPTPAQRALIGAIAEELDGHRKRVLAGHSHLTLTKLYNVLERLRAGTPATELPKDERRIYDDGLVLILKELHDRLDAAVAAAYGWPADLAEEAVLARLVALNRERAAEERRGLVRWLRPDYQVPRFGSEAERARQTEAALVGVAEGTASGAKPKPLFPRDDRDQTSEVMALLFRAPRPLDAIQLATAFRQGRKVQPKVDAVLAALVRTGVAASDDGGRTFSVGRP